MKTLTRRSFLRNTGLALTGTVMGAPAVRGAARGRVLETRVISHQPEVYHGWPTLTRRKGGQLLLAWSGGRVQHVCPFGRVELMRSDDEGRNWSWPRVLLDSAIDDRDAGVLETVKGTLLVTTFTSLAYEPGIQGRAEWLAAHNRLGEAERRKELGQWMIRSTDGGVTWSQRYSSIVNSPHGPFQLADGRLLYAGKELWTGGKRVGVCQSADDGVTWEWLAEIPVRPGDVKEEYHELHGVEAGPGRIVVQIRNHNRANQGETLQTVSVDGGKSWSVPVAIGVWGLPSFLTRLRDGRLLMTYGHRRAPLGNQARVSEDAGATWPEAMILSGDGLSGDLGYPSTVELGDGSLLTVWYEVMAGSGKAVLRQARWVVEG